MTISLRNLVVAMTTLFLFTMTAGTALAAPLSDPSNLGATAISASEIDISWTDNSSKEDGFSIERSADGVNYSEVATVGKNVESYSDSNLSSNTTYHYQVRAFQNKRNGTQYSDYSNTDSDTTFDVAPTAPTNLSATAATSAVVYISWTDNADNETGFKVERDSGLGFVQVATVGANVESYGDGPLADGTYTYRVSAYNAEGDSGYSNTSNVSIVTIPSAPSALSVSALADDATLTWTDNSNNETGFVIERNSGNGFVVLASTSADATNYSDLNLADGTYNYRVYAQNTAGNSGYSNTDGVTIQTAPAAPSNLSAIATGTTISVNWTDNADNETGFKVERDSGSGFVQVANLPANTTTYQDTSLTDGNYTYRVRTYNLVDHSTYSNTDTAVIVTLPTAPSNLDASVSNDDVALTWTDNSSNETGFVIERSTDGTNFSLIATTTISSFNDYNLADGTYHYRVYAYNGAGNSEYSNTDQAIIDTATPPAAPSNLMAFASSSSLTLVWTDNSSDEDNFELERGTDGVSFSLIATENANTTFYFDSPLSATTTYYYRVRATNSAGASAYSNTTSGSPS